MVSSNFITQNAHFLLAIFLVFLLNLGCHNSFNHCSYLSHANLDSLNTTSQDLVSSLKNLLNGHFDFDNTSLVAFDFGNIYHFVPLAILFPKTVSDISTTIKHVIENGRNNTNLTVTPRGHGHSFQGQSENQGGVVISMESLEEPRVLVQIGEQPYVDVSGGELWINILRETLKQGLAPKSWIDYLNLTVGGTLSNAGFSGQAFRHGPQINNVIQLEVVTGKGDIVNCSEEQNADLFYGVLGGLGQFGIITKARISLENAPKLVKWIRVLYSNFSMFTKDQEQLISANVTFDYIEGFVMMGLINNGTTTLSLYEPQQATSPFGSEGTTLYCLEIAKYFNPEQTDIVNKDIETMLSTLNYITHTVFQSEVSYVDFLDRVHLSDLKLRGEELKNVTNPWFTLLIPKSKIHIFAEEVFGRILTNTSYGPILLYPFNQSSWKDRTSFVTPTEDVIYLASFLASATPSSVGSEGLESLLTLRKRILEFCDKANVGAKQYSPFHETEDEWRAHFGTRWELFALRKSTYDPQLILTPHQRIFHKK